MAAVAANKGIAPTRLAASVESCTQFAGRQTTTHFRSHLDLGEGLTKRERVLLFNAARLCEVHKMLRGEMTFEEYLDGGP